MVVRAYGGGRPSPRRHALCGVQARGTMVRRSRSGQRGPRGDRRGPLSEDEEGILQQIAQRFHEDEPTFAREVGKRTLARHSVTRMKWSVVFFVLGAAFLIAMLATSFWLSFVGFLV